MNQLKYFLLAISGFLLVSCSNEDPVVSSGNGEGTSNITLNLSTHGFRSRDISDGTTANKLYYALYDKTSGSLKKITVETPDAGSDSYAVENGEDFNMSTVKTFKLVDGHKYGIAFWAANEDSPYTVDFDDNAVTMTANYLSDGVSRVKANDEALDAFYGYTEFEVKGDAQLNLTLTRPFAQINIGTSDLAAYKAMGYEPLLSTIKVKSYTTLDLVTGETNGLTESEVVFNDNEIPSDRFPVEGYDYLASTYILVPRADSQVVDIAFSYKNSTDESIDNSRVVGSVPVNRNHRTNIYGKILTSNEALNVHIKHIFEDSDNQEILDNRF